MKARARDPGVVEAHQGVRASASRALTVCVVLSMMFGPGCWRPQASGVGRDAVQGSQRGLAGSREDFPVAGVALQVTMDGPNPGTVSLVGFSSDADGQRSQSEVDVPGSVDELVRPAKRLASPRAEEREYRGYMDALVPP